MPGISKISCASDSEWTHKCLPTIWHKTASLIDYESVSLWIGALSWNSPTGEWSQRCTASILWKQGKSGWAWAWTRDHWFDVPMLLPTELAGPKSGSTPGGQITILGLITSVRNKYLIKLLRQEWHLHLAWGLLSQFGLSMKNVSLSYWSAMDSGCCKIPPSENAKGVEG